MVARRRWYQALGALVFFLATGWAWDAPHVQLRLLALARICLPDPGNYAVSVTPYGSPVTWTSNTTGHTSTFTVTNVGLCAESYSFSYTASGPISGVSLDKTGAYLARGASTTVTATYNVGAPGSGVLTLTATGAVGGDQSTGSYNVTVVAPPTPAVSVTPHGGTAPTRTANTNGYNQTFTITNTGNVQTTYTLTCGGSSNVSCTRINLTSVTLAAGAAATDTAYYNVTVPGTGTLSLTAAGSGVSDVGSYTVPVVSYGVAVTPKGATTANRLANTGGYADTFRVANTGSASNTYNVTCSGGSNVTCTGISAASVTLNAGTSTIDTARYSVGAVGTGTLTLTATGTNATDAGSDTVPVVAAVPQAPLVDVNSVNAGALTKRGVCLTIAMGAAAAAECGDLRIVHSLPTTRSLNKARTPTLLYNSQTAHPYPLLAANVTLPTTAVVPDSVTGTLTINAVVRARGKWIGTEWIRGQTRRVVIAYDGLSDATGIYAYTLEIRNWYPATSQPTTVNGQLAVVNRSGSAFGAGWWLAGLEQLNVGTMTWTGGDGSVRQYQPVTGQTSVWVAPSLDHPDTLRKDASGNYIRSDKDSVRVRFDPTGLHIATINRQEHTTTFAYSSGRLNMITLPPASASKVYQFNYDANGKLNSVDAPGPDGVTPRTTTSTVTSGLLMAIQDPDLTSVSFGYDPSFGNRITTRTDRRGTVTTYGFDAGNKLAQASVNVGASQAPLITRLTASESRGLPGSGTPSSLDTAIAYTKFSGPRNLGDTTLFWVDRFGAPRKVIDALGNATRLTRGDPRWPVLVTGLKDAAGRIISATYDTLRGNLISTTDSSAFDTVYIDCGPGCIAHYNNYATTSYLWDAKWDAIRKITHPVGDSLAFAYDPATGNLLSRQDGRGPVSQVSFGYNTANQVVSVTAPNTPLERIGYDALGNVDSTTTPKGYLTTYQNDAVGRVTILSSPIDTVAGSSRQRVEHRFYDNADRDTLTIVAGPAMPSALAESMFVRKRYNASGQRDSLSRWARPDITHIGTITTRWKYDTVGRVIAEIAPDGFPDSMFYDPAGNDTLQVTRRQLRISMTYDALNRLTTRRLPSVAYAQRPSGITVLGGGLPNSYAAYQIAADTQTFTYDPMGRILTANNGDAKVKRSYYVSGFLRTDSSWIRTVQGTDFTQHVYGTGVGYDLDGHRTSLGGPTQLDASGYGSGITLLYDPQFGALTRVQQVLVPQNSTFDNFIFGYSPRGELVRVNWDSASAQYRENLSYDADGRLAADTIRNLGGTAWPRWAADPIRAITYTYDARDNLTSGKDPLEFQDTLAMSYSGLGHLVQSNLSEHTPCTGRYTAAETFSYDGLGNQSHANTVHAIAAPYCNESSDSSGSGYAYVPGTGRLVHDTVPGSVTTYTYDSAGDAEFSQNLGAPAEERATYYAADGKVRAVDWRRAAGPNTHFGFWTRAFDEYRYDALGRRIWARSQKSCNDGGTMSVFQATECQTGVLRRSIWDQDQVLAEIQMPGDSTSRDIPYWENDTAAVVLATIPAGPGTGDPSRYFGRVVYAHVFGIDHPVSVTRYDYVYAIDAANNPVSPAVVLPMLRIMPFWNALGDPALGAFTTGGEYYCTPPTSTTACVGVTWPYLFAAYDRQHSMTRDNWHGSLLESGRDKSGLEFKRNRYYDPQIGRFTQEDPLGLAGGLNLYGFAKGDPVNFSDPFGLCPVWVDGIPCVSPFAGSSELVAAGGPPPSGPRGSEFGITRYSGGVRDVYHDGLDAAAQIGTGIRAPAGAVATTGTDTKSGLYVSLDLGNGYTVSFAHLSDVPEMFKDAQGNIDHSISVNVKPGELVGFVGTTGNAATSGRDPHTHIRTKENGQDFNPRDFYSDPLP